MEAHDNLSGMVDHSIVANWGARLEDYMGNSAEREIMKDALIGLYIIGKYADLAFSYGHDQIMPTSASHVIRRNDIGCIASELLATLHEQAELTGTETVNVLMGAVKWAGFGTETEEGITLTFYGRSLYDKLIAREALLS